jgi:hypothetical protein
VRAEWDSAIMRGDGRVRVAEEPENGSATGPALMGLADDIESGKIPAGEAIAKARAIIAEATADADRLADAVQ